MLTIRELIKTLYNALIQRMKKYRGNWEQNDPTADDYIKNRPFYTDETDKTIIIPKQQIEVASGREAAASGGFTTISLSPIIELVVGQSYDIVWNGKNYICTAYEFDGLGVVGNDSVMSGNDTGEPFFIAISKDMFGGAYIYAYTTGTHTVEVTTVKIVKIDKKYLPDDLITDLAPVATSGSYNDLSDKPIIYTDVVRYGTAQSLTAAQKKTGKTNIGAVGYDTAQNLTTANKTIARTNIGAVGYEAQTLTDAQKTQARTNIGAGTSSFSGSYNDLTDKPDTIQPDWNENNSDEKSYIVNRPCYIENIIGNILYQGNKFIGVDDSSVLNPLFSNLTNGALVDFILNGKIYTGVIKDTHLRSSANTYHVKYIGNPNLWQETAEDTGEDYLFIIYLNVSSSYSSLGSWTYIDGVQIHDTYEITIKYSDTTNIHQLDEKFIPNTIQRVGNDIILNSSTEGSTKQFKLTIDDSGILAAAEVVQQK